MIGNVRPLSSRAKQGRYKNKPNEKKKLLDLIASRLKWIVHRHNMGSSKFRGRTAVLSYIL